MQYLVKKMSLSFTLSYLTPPQMVVWLRLIIHHAAGKAKAAESRAVRSLHAGRRALSAHEPITERQTPVHCAKRYSAFTWYKVGPSAADLRLVIASPQRDARGIA